MQRQLIDLSHSLEDGLETYKGLEPIHICDYWSREMSQQNYQEGTSFQIGKITMVANSGTYLDTPFHRYQDGDDLSELSLDQVAELDAIKVIITDDRRVIDSSCFESLNIKHKAVIIQTNWSQHWGSAHYSNGKHPYINQDAAEYLRDNNVKLVGIDSYNIDNTAQDTRPAHSILLGANILIVEHLTNLQKIPNHEFIFSAVPVKVKGMGTFPVRAYAKIEANL
jgi:arylformamidase